MPLLHYLYVGIAYLLMAILLVLMSPILVIFGLFALADKGGEAIGGEAYTEGRNRAAELLHNVIRLAILAAGIFLVVVSCNPRSRGSVECDWDGRTNPCIRS